MIKKDIFNKIFLWTVVLMLQTFWVTPAAGAFKHYREGMSAPEIRGVDINTNQEISLKGYLDNKYVIVFFWATWSPRSLLQLEETKDLISDYNKDSIQVIAVNVDQPELSSKELADIEEFVKEMNLPFPVIIDKGLEIFYTYGVIAVPSTAIIDNTGILRFAPSGYSLATRDIIVDSIETFLGLTKKDAVVIKKGHTPDKKASRYYGMALKLYNKHMYKRSLIALESAKSLDSVFASPYTLEGEINIKIDKFDEAITAFNRAIELDSNSITSWSGLGHAYFMDNKFDSAGIILGKAIQLDNTYVPALVDYGIVLANTGNPQGGLDSLKSAIELNPRNVWAYYYSGRIYHTMEMDSNAVETYLSALRILYPEN